MSLLSNTSPLCPQRFNENLEQNINFVKSVKKPLVVSPQFAFSPTFLYKAASFTSFNEQNRLINKNMYGMTTYQYSNLVCTEAFNLDNYSE